MSVTRLEMAAYLQKKVGPSANRSKILKIWGHISLKSIISGTAGPKNFLW